MDSIPPGYNLGMSSGLNPSRFLTFCLLTTLLSIEEYYENDYLEAVMAMFTRYGYPIN